MKTLKEWEAPVNARAGKRAGARRSDRWRQYQEYINSKAWEDRRKQYLEDHGSDCQACETSSRKVHVHHLSYESMGTEPDADLMGLCWWCHKEVHAYHKEHRGMSLRRATEEWVALGMVPPVMDPTKRRRGRKRK